MTRDEAQALAQTRNTSREAGRWFAREQDDGWDVVRLAAPFAPQPKVVHPGQEPKRGLGPDPAPSMPGLVTPWNAGT